MHNIYFETISLHSGHSRVSSSWLKVRPNNLQHEEKKSERRAPAKIEDALRLERLQEAKGWQSTSVKRTVRKHYR